jgi:anaerobic carbon-monoxide dehydrogenase catalytic subunit
MAEETKVKEKAEKLADPVAASIDVATQQMIARAQQLGIDTVFDRAEQMKPCNIGIQGICCKNCAMGPCRLPLPKAGIVGEDTRKGLCGATANTIAARNFIRMIAGGAAAHSDHGRSVAEVFMSAARKETDAYKIKDTVKLLAVAENLGVATTSKSMAKPKTATWMKSPWKSDQGAQRMGQGRRRVGLFETGPQAALR